MAKRLSKRDIYERLPSSIQDAPLINWKMVRGKKIPVDQRGRTLSKLNSDPSTTVFNVALEAVEFGRADGIGLPIYVSNFCAIDIDDCVEHGAIAPWALEVIEKCDSYTEISPSGNGLHILMTGSPSCGNHTQIAQGSGHMDIFADKGYLTLTGRPLAGFGDKPLRDGSGLVVDIYESALPTSRAIKRIRKHRKGRDLFAGNISGYDSPSEADLAFVSIVAPLVKGNRDLILKLIRQSGLYRKKWDRVDYANRTIDKVLNRRDSFEFDGDPGVLVRPIFDFLQLELPPPEWIVKGFLAKGTINMIFGPGGVGKSQFLYSLLMSLDQGRRFMYWDIPIRRRVLLIDTEMPERLIQSRLQSWFGANQPDSALVLSSALFRAATNSHFKLDNEDHQQLLHSLITEHQIDVVIIDPLAPALDCDENSNNDVGLYMPFLTQLRDEGVTVILSHHSGKSEESGQRGASRRRDYLDLSLQLVNAKVLKNARFTTKFDKVREETPEPPTWTSELMWDEAFIWSLSSNLLRDDEPLVRSLTYLFEHTGKLNVTKMAEELGYLRNRMYSIFDRAAAHDLIVRKTKELTEKGIDLVMEVTPDESD